MKNTLLTVATLLFFLIGRLITAKSNRSNALVILADEQRDGATSALRATPAPPRGILTLLRVTARCCSAFTVPPGPDAGGSGSVIAEAVLKNQTVNAVRHRNFTPLTFVGFQIVTPAGSNQAP